MHLINDIWKETKAACQASARPHMLLKNTLIIYLGNQNLRLRRIVHIQKSELLANLKSFSYFFNKVALISKESKDFWRIYSSAPVQLLKSSDLSFLEFKSENLWAIIVCNTMIVHWQRCCTKIIANMSIHSSLVSGPFTTYISFFFSPFISPLPPHLSSFFFLLFLLLLSPPPVPSPPLSSFSSSSSSLFSPPPYIFCLLFLFFIFFFFLILLFFFLSLLFVSFSSSISPPSTSSASPFLLIFLLPLILLLVLLLLLLLLYPLLLELCRKNIVLGKILTPFAFTIKKNDILPITRKKNILPVTEPQNWIKKKYFFFTEQECFLELKSPILLTGHQIQRSKIAQLVVCKENLCLHL